MAIERVKTRVIEGGHNIETNVIKRRYKNGITNLFTIYIDIVDEVLIFDNSSFKPDLIADKIKDSEINTVNNYKFEKLKKYYNEKT